MSYSSLSELCRLQKVRPQNARDLTRLLRAAVLAPAEGCEPALLLDVRDRRTLRVMFKRAGLTVPDTGLSVECILDQQQLIEPKHPVVARIRERLCSVD